MTRPRCPLVYNLNSRSTSDLVFPLHAGCWSVEILRVLTQWTASCSVTGYVAVPGRNQTLFCVCFDHVTVFEALYLRTSIKGGADTNCVDSWIPDTSVQCVCAPLLMKVLQYNALSVVVESKCANVGFPSVTPTNTLGHHNLGPHYCMVSLCCSWLHLMIVITPFLINMFAMSLYIGFAKWNDFLPRWYDVISLGITLDGEYCVCMHPNSSLVCLYYQKQSWPHSQAFLSQVLITCSVQKWSASYQKLEVKKAWERG